MPRPVKETRQPSLYRPVSILDSVGKLFEKFQPTRVLRGVSERELLHDEQFGFPPRHSTTQHLARIVEGVNRNPDEKKLAGAVFLDMAKAFETAWAKGLL
jgi:hypothetical protein